MATIILVHGAWHGAWCWRHVVPLLEAHGHTVRAPDLPGHGADRAEIGEQSLDAYVQCIADRVAVEDQRVVLVGHRLGGLVISAVAETLPDCVRSLVYVTAFLPLDGDSLARICSADRDNPLGRASRPTPDGKCLSLDPVVAGELLYGDCSAADRDFALAKVGPEPLAVMRTPVKVTAERFGRIARSYLHCSLDVAVPMWLQEQMVAASPCTTVLTLTTGHSPFFAAPGLLAAAVDEISGNRIEV